MSATLFAKIHDWDIESCTLRIGNNLPGGYTLWQLEEIKEPGPLPDGGVTFTSHSE